MDDQAGYSSSKVEFSQPDASCFVVLFSEGDPSQATEKYVDACGCFPTSYDGGRQRFWSETGYSLE